MAKRQRKDEARAETARLLLRLAAVASVLLPLPLQAASSATHAGLLDAPTLLMLGINVGVIAFAIATAIGCLRATERAKEASQRAALEAERLRASESLLDTVLSAEPQAMLIWPGSGNPRMLAANLSPALGVPSDAEPLLRFSDWLDEASAAALENAMRNLSERGEAFNLMLSTRAQKHIEADGRTSGGMISLKIRDLAGERLDYANLKERHKQLDAEVASLRGLLDAEAATRSSAARKTSETSLRGFDRLATAFAVFDAEQRLDNFNQAFVQLWQLDADWLAGRPKDGEILDRLRELGLIDKTNIIVVSDHGFGHGIFGVNVAGELIKAGLKLGADSDDVVLASSGQTLSLHVRDLPLFDYREALRASTRLGPPEEEEYEEEG